MGYDTDGIAAHNAETRTEEITYAELRDGDVILDKSGNRWNVSNIWTDAWGQVGFFLGTPTAPKIHSMEKPRGDKVTVVRPVSHEATMEKVEAETTLPIPKTEASVEAIAAATGATVVATETAEEADARTKATLTGVPVDLPLFHEMTPLEQHSHLYLLHGVYAYDVTDLAELASTHDNLHSLMSNERDVPGRVVAHTHTLSIAKEA